MPLPNFIFIGPDKAGSSWLHKALNLHPEVYITPAKDTYFFNENYSRGVLWYERQFAGAGSASVVGEICHDYLFDPAVAARMQSVLDDDLRLMVCLREPVTRAHSAYLNMLKNGWKVGSFEEAIATHPELLTHGLYGKHLESYRDFIDRGAMFVSFFDDLQRDPRTFYLRLTEWLGLSPINPPREALKPERMAGIARSPWLARLAKRGAVFARKLGWVAVVGRIKTSRAAQATLYRTYAGGARPEIPDHLAERLRQAFVDDLAVAEEILGGVDLRRRWNYA